MKRFFIVVAITITFVPFSSCKQKANDYPETNFVVYDWNFIKHNGNSYYPNDKYGNSFKDYNIFYNLENITVPAIYYSSGEKSGKTEIKTYVGDDRINFISQTPKWNFFFEPLVYGNLDNPRFNYLDNYDNVDRLSVLITSNNSAIYQDGEYILSHSLSSEVWSILNKMEKNTSNMDDSEWKKTNLEAWLYLYIKDVNAAVYVGILCYNENDVLCVSNTNYTELYPLSSQLQDFDELLKKCEYVENSLLLEQ